VGEILLPLLPRHRLVLASKLYNSMSDDPNDRGLSRKHILHSIDASLRRLRTDHIDLWQIHRFDYDTPLEETLEALDSVVRAGKVRYLGASSMFAWQFMKALGLQRANGWAPFVSMQPHYNLIYREEEREMLPLCRAEGIGVLPWSPLARGVLAGKRVTPRSDTDATARSLYDASRIQDEAIAATVAEIATERGVPMARIAYAWVASRPGITAPLIGVTRRGQLDDAVAALGLSLSAEEVERMESAYRPKPVAGHS
jgi:aryl-alcohol dehydrogenase-like predicted oxidoreductase